MKFFNGEFLNDIRRDCYSSGRSIDYRKIKNSFHRTFNRCSASTCESRTRAADTCCENRREIACIDASRGSLKKGKKIAGFPFFFIAGITAILFEALCKEVRLLRQLLRIMVPLCGTATLSRRPYKCRYEKRSKRELRECARLCLSCLPFLSSALLEAHYNSNR